MWIIWFTWVFYAYWEISNPLKSAEQLRLVGIITDPETMEEDVFEAVVKLKKELDHFDSFHHDLKLTNEDSREWRDMLMILTKK